MSNKKIKVKMNPLLNKSVVRDTISGIVFKGEWVEIPVETWERLKDNKFNQGGQRIPVLIADDDVVEEEPIDNSTEEDNESVEEVVEDFFIAEEE
jgi:hypothetical protein